MTLPVRAAGILPYDDQGFYVIVERRKGKWVYNDIGGKCQTGDPHYVFTAIREFNEETYYQFHLSTTIHHILSQYEYQRPVGDCVYVSYLVPVEVLMSYMTPETKPVHQTPHGFKPCIQKANSVFPSWKYPVTELHRISFDALDHSTILPYPLSFRLESIIGIHDLAQEIIQKLAYKSSTETLAPEDGSANK